MMFDVKAWLEELIPNEYRAYQPVIGLALGYFVGHLSPARQGQIRQHQAALGAQASSAERLVALMRDCPTLHKLGQVLARDPRLLPAFRERLQSLESCLPLASVSDFDWPAELEAGSALAEGSVASVFACDWRGYPVVSKRLKPGVAERLAEEFELWGSLSRQLGDWCRQADLPVFDYASIIASLIHLLQDELHPQREQQQLLAAAQRFLSQAQVHVPRVYPQLIESGVVMERIVGTPLLEHARGAELFPLAVQVLITDPFFSPEEDGIFHLDPHPGNLWVTNEGRLALLDWGSTLALPKHRRLLLTHALLSAWRGDQQDWEFYASQLTGQPVGPCPRGGALSGMFEPACWGEQLPIDLILLRKILFHLEGVEAQLGQSQLGWQLFLQAGARFIAELPLRLAAPATWRGFSTHVSNLDIVRHAVLKFWSSD
jgi:ubiquinone biosynthesis protein